MNKKAAEVPLCSCPHRTHTDEEEREIDKQRAWVRVMPRTCPGCGKRNFTCGPACPLVVELARAKQDDRDWFRKHTNAQERVRPWTVAEQVGQFHTSGVALGSHVRIVRTGRWWTNRGVPTHEMLRYIEVDDG